MTSKQTEEYKNQCQAETAEKLGGMQGAKVWKDAESQHEKIVELCKKQREADSGAGTCPRKTTSPTGVEK